MFKFTISYIIEAVRKLFLIKGIKVFVSEDREWQVLYDITTEDLDYDIAFHNESTDREISNEIESIYNKIKWMKNDIVVSLWCRKNHDDYIHIEFRIHKRLH